MLGPSFAVTPASSVRLCYRVAGLGRYVLALSLSPKLVAGSVLWTVAIARKAAGLAA